MSIHAKSKRPLAGLLGASTALLLLAPGCASQRDFSVSTETSTVTERTLPPPPTMIDIAIVDLHDEPALDPSQEKVVGTVVNEGDRPVSQIAIRVNALDRAGNVVNTITTPPLPETIAAFGGRTRFEAYMPRDPDVAGYHAVAVAR